VRIVVSGAYLCYDLENAFCESRIEMIGALLLIPALLIRYALPLFVDKDAMKRLSFTPAPKGREKMAFWVYIPSTFAMLVYLFFTKIVAASNLFYIGAAVYSMGVLLYAISMFNFGQPAKKGVNTKGLYRFSRNPIYVAFFIFLLGCALITQSLIFLILLIIYQVSVHWVILSEERWCLAEFGDEYKRYMKSVRRYL
jgi:protein-S-isoprenylcysteine O-methyltransferase Ste14